MIEQECKNKECIAKINRILLENEALRRENKNFSRRLFQTQLILWDDKSDSLGCETAWEEALIRTRALFDVDQYYEDKREEEDK